MNKLIVGLCIVVGCCTQLFSQEIEMSWLDVVSIASSQNYDVLVSQSAIRQAGFSVLMSESAYLPQVSLSTSVSDGGSLAYGLSGKQLLYDWHQTKEKINQSEWQQVLTHDSYNLVSSTVRFSLRSTFVSVLQNQELIVILNEILKRRQQNYELVSLRYEAGREHKGALLSSKASLDQSLFDVDQAMKQLDVDKLTLATLMGDMSLKELRVTGNFTSDDVLLKKPTISDLVEQNLTVIQKKHQQDLALTNINAVIAARYPQLSGSVGFSGSLNNRFGEANDISVGAGLSVTIADGGKRDAELEKAKLAYFDAVVALEKARADSRVELENAWNAVVNSIQQVALQRQFYNAAKERSKIAEAQYSTGLLSFDNWTIIEDNLVRTQKSYLQAVGSALIAQAAYDRVIGGTLEDEK